MNRKEAEDFVRSCGEDEGPTSEYQLAEIFEALYDRAPDDEDADIWSLCCAAVSDEESADETVSISAKRYEDCDDCLSAAAADYVAEHPELAGYDLDALDA
jgi:hypothetical protein